MSCAQFITGVYRVSVQTAACKPNAHAGFTGFTGFTGLRACTCAHHLFQRSIPKIIHFLLTCEINPVNPVNPVTSLIQQGFQRIRVALKVCKTLINERLVMAKPSMREQMPMTAAWIDSLREAFGKDMIDQQIRRGMAGQPTFWAHEGGHAVGTPSSSTEPKGQ